MGTMFLSNPHCKASLVCWKALPHRKHLAPVAKVAVAAKAVVAAKVASDRKNRKKIPPEQRKSQKKMELDQKKNRKKIPPEERESQNETALLAKRRKVDGRQKGKTLLRAEVLLIPVWNWVQD